MANNGRRPFDVLDSSKDGNVLVQLKGYSGTKTTVSGELQAFDKHLNIWLDNARVNTEDGQIDYGNLFLS